VQAAIALLAEDPRPPASRALRGRPAWRVRVGDYRIIYAIEDDLLLIVESRSGTAARSTSGDLFTDRCG
jgi:mRNA-degrading endonuclease RelE of RelBE toxin-antitoxin system